MYRGMMILLSLILLLGQPTSAAERNAEAKAALEKLNWKITVAAYTYRNFTFWETVEKVADLGVDSIYGFNFQKIGGGLEGNLDPAAMSDETLAKVKAKLDAAGLDLVALYYGGFPNDETACRKIFERSKRLGIRYFVSEPQPEQLPMLDRLAQEYGIIVGQHGHDKKSSPNTWHPVLVAKECAKYTPAIGAFNDTGHWIRSELEPSEGVAILKGRTVGFDLHDLDTHGRDVPLGTGVGKIAEMLETLAAVNPNPVLIGIEYNSNPENPTPDVEQCLAFLEKEAVRIASQPLKKVPPRKKPGFYVGAASCDLTPERPVFLSGQFHTRIASEASTPVIANVVVMESVGEEGSSDCVFLLSMDTCVIRPEFNQAFRKAFRETFPQWDVNKLILSATHTHAAPHIGGDGYYRTDQKEVMSSSEYIAFCIPRMLAAIEKAWGNRSAGKYAYGLDFAVVACNRRAVYADGTAVMYGNTNDPNFRAIEGMEDHDVGTLFFWNADDQLIAMLVNVACPAQVHGSVRKIDADFWAPVRTMLQKKYGQDLVVLGLCGAAGDMAPHIRYRQTAEVRMQEMRKLGRAEELARRIVDAVDQTWEVVERTREKPSILKNLYAEVQLPERKITEDDYRKAISEAERLEKVAAQSKEGGAYTQAKWHRNIAHRWEKLKENPNPMYPTCIHVVRIGDAVLCTNQFELYADFGVQMKARSAAKQMFVVQLCDGLVGGGTYLPSKRAMQGGGYGAVIQSNMVGAEGGQVLVEKTLELVNQLFPKK
ncbi:MAG: hypothetical protein Q4D62_06210 [Planctomycetia bacterium]|nr:hypothetical protein [Planctomycetia bacterium]